MPERGEIEAQLVRSHSRLVGVDEVGKGCIAGPVYTAAVVLDYARLAGLGAKERRLIRDSKTLSLRQREQARGLIDAVSAQWALGSASAAEIDQLGIATATSLAMRRSLAQLDPAPDLVLVDGKWPIADCSLRQKPIIKGDFLCYNIAAASILAKLARDQLMGKEAERYPAYGFERHVGYPTKAHLQVVAREGGCPLHRQSFAPLRFKTARSSV